MSLFKSFNRISSPSFYALLSASMFLQFNSTISFADAKTDYFIKFSKKSSHSTKVNQVEFLNKIGLNYVSKFNFGNVYVVSSAEELNIQALSKQYAQDIEYLEKVEMLEAHKINKPNDKNFSAQWGLGGGQSSTYSFEAPKAWQYETGSKDTLVCIIDSGIDYLHEDLKDNIWLNPGESGIDEQGRNKASNGIDDDNNGYVDDFRGWDFVNSDNDPMDGDKHGTHVAGIVGAVGNNRKGISGVSWKVSLVPIKTLDDEGGGTYADAMRGIEYCANIGAKISNNSYGGKKPSDAFDDLMDWLEGQNHLFVSSAGNSATNNDEQPNYPASYPHENIISVGASTKEGERSGFSNFGPSSVDVFAPGEAILSTVPDNEYQQLEGTSMASPFVAGAAALYLSKYPDKNIFEVRSEIVKTVKKSFPIFRYSRAGGVVNLYNLMEPDSLPPSEVKQLALADQTYIRAKISFMETGDSGNQGKASYYKYYFTNTDSYGQKIGEPNELGVVKETFEKTPSEVKGMVEVILKGFEINAQGVIQVVAFDNKNQRSELSEPLRVSLDTPSEVGSYRGNTLYDLRLADPWGIVEIDSTLYLSDSPDGHYEDSANVKLRLPDIRYSEDSFISLSLNYALETYYDFLIVEARTNKTNSYSELGRITGYGENKTFNFDLIGSGLENQGANKLEFRIRLTSDSFVSSDGVHIKSISIFD